MKTTYQQLALPVLVFILLFSGCKPDIPQELEDMRNMAVPESFNFETTQEINISIKLPASVDYSERNKIVSIYSELPENDGDVIHSGAANNQGHYYATVQVPPFTDTLYIHSFAGWKEVAIESTLKGFSEDYEADYGDDYYYEKPDSSMEGLPAGGTEITFYTRELKSGGNFVSNGDFEQNEFGAQDDWESAMSLTEIWNFSNHVRTLGKRSVSDNNAFIEINNSSNRDYYGGVTQLINANPGEEITFSADYKMAGRGIVWLFLIPRDANNKPITYYSTKHTKKAKKWKNKKVSATMPANTVTCQVLFWSHNLKNTTISYDNAVVSIKGRVLDSDGDGVEDDEDAYPNDANKVTNNYFPGLNTFGTIAFEDMWPNEGDYDFNDLVVGYRFNHIKNADNEITALDIRFQLRAIGASIHNGFGIELDIAANKVASVSSTYTLPDGDYTIAANGTETGNAKASIIVFDDAFKILQHPGTGVGVNTNPDIAYVEPVNVDLTIEFTEGLKMQELGNAPNNPFLFRSSDRSWEIHLPGYTPTDLADESKFGTGDDATNPGNNKFYKTARGLPWGMNVPKEFIYPTEKTPIIKGHLKFQQWATSGGYSFMDWYDDVDGYRDNGKLYTRRN